MMSLRLRGPGAVLAAVLVGGLGAAELAVTVDGIEVARGGVVQVILFAGPAGFPDDPARGQRTATLALDGPTLTTVFTDLPPGRYAVAVLHDADRDGRVDTNLLGIPTEGIGVSRNVVPAWRSPRFAEAAVALAGEPVRVAVTLVYR